MNERNDIIRRPEWSISHTTGTHIIGSRLSVFRFYQLPLTGPKKTPAHQYRTVMALAECDGVVFGPDAKTGQDNARKYLEDNGFTKRYSRNTCKFHTNRTFRKHTGCADIHEYLGETDFLWDCSQRNRARRFGHFSRTKKGM